MDSDAPIREATTAELEKWVLDELEQWKETSSNRLAMFYIKEEINKRKESWEQIEDKIDLQLEETTWLVGK